jgi:hypothetical protein
MSFACSIYGIGINVNVPIAGIAGLRAPSRVDIEISLGTIPASIAQIRSQDWQEHHRSAEVTPCGTPYIRVLRRADASYHRIEYIDGTVVVIDGSGSRIWAAPPEQASIEDTATYLLGPILTFALRLRGVTCLHASAVVIDGQAIAIVGPSGSGKSTAAAEFARLGYDVLTDDVLALAQEAGHFVAQPAYPRIRLWPESVGLFFGRHDALPRITQGWEKRYLDLQKPEYRFRDTPSPLRAIYLLGDRSADPAAPVISCVSARTGLLSLVANASGTYFLDKAMRAHEFEMLARLASCTALRQVTPSVHFERLTELCELIVADCHRLAPDTVTG